MTSKGELTPGAHALRLLAWACFLLIQVSTLAFAATGPTSAPAAVGEVIFVEGAATAQAPGAPPRFLQRGEPLFEGEVVSTGQGYAIIGFKDGSRFTLRANTSFTIERFRQGAQTADSAAFRLLKGGFRAVTGLMSKRDPQAMQVNTGTATIGIRGTQFDARICTSDCAEEQGRTPRKPQAEPPPLVVARVALLSGAARAVDSAGTSRTLAQGSALFNGDTVRTDKASHAVLAFRDQSKITVIADSEFRLDNVRFAGQKGEEGNFAVRIVRGGVRALTGLLAKSNPKAVNFSVTTAVIGVRGTGFDGHIGVVTPPAGNAGEGVGLNVRAGATDLTMEGQVLAVNEGQGAVAIPGQKIVALVTPPPPFPDPNAPLPESVPVDFDALFAENRLDSPPPGLHVGMRGVGEVVVITKLNQIGLAGNEAALVRDEDSPAIRVTPNWAVELNNNLPDPSTFDPGQRRVQFTSGSVICEIR